MLRLTNLNLPLSFPYTDSSALAAKAAQALHLTPAQVTHCELKRLATDARKKHEVHFVCTLVAEVQADESALARRFSFCEVILPDSPPAFPISRPFAEPRPVVAGMGPAGMFAALTLARAGTRPLVLERGKPIGERQRDVERFWSKGVLCPDSNVQFGEGGAGTFSDGKLTTGVKDPNSRLILETFVRHGGPKEILYQARPHLGTDRLTEIVRGIRNEILNLGGEILFQHTLLRPIFKDGVLQAVWVRSPQGEKEIPAYQLILAVGHSARDTFSALLDAGLPMEAKPFSVGCRVEHPQWQIDRCQYGSFAGHPALSPADYKLSHHTKDGRGVYTFCMCPGGRVVAAASEKGGVVTNGMSLYARNDINANSAVLVGVTPADFGTHPLDGVRFQQELERKAYALTGGYRAPSQNVSDFLAGHISFTPAIQPSYRPGVIMTDLSRLFPPFITQALREGLMVFECKMKGFSRGLLTGPETRSSSPVRILRNAETLQSAKAGIYPCGEGAGYAGGIMSAAIDGIKCARRVLESR